MGLIPFVFFTLTVVASGQDFPAKPIRMIVPYPAGGVIDFVARQVGQKMTPWHSRWWWRTVSAQAARIGTEAVARSTPDGYSVLVVFDTHAVNPHVYKNLRYDTFKDLAAVSLTGVDLLHVPYRGGAPLLIALLGEQVQLGVAAHSKDRDPSGLECREITASALAIMSSTEQSGAAVGVLDGNGAGSFGAGD